MLKAFESGNLLVSFSGEHGAELQQVHAITPGGAVAAVGLGQSFRELRGMAIDATPGAWRLYLVEAHKEHSRIYVFDASGDRQSAITPKASAGLWHPYEVAVSGDSVYVSNQDSNTVLAFERPVSGEDGVARPIASYLSSNPAWANQYPGTIVASHAPQANQGVTPDEVPKSDGGLDFDGAVKHSVRGVAIAKGILYVADEPGDRILRYQLSDGSYLGELTSSKQHALESPVGCALNPADGCLYFGSTGNRRIFRHDPTVGDDDLSVFLHDDTKLHKVSGIAFSASGDLYTASRSTRLVYHAPSGSTELQPLVADTFCDTPECLVVVP